jgi:hypothetical protein
MDISVSGRLGQNGAKTQQYSQEVIIAEFQLSGGNKSSFNVIFVNAKKTHILQLINYFPKPIFSFSCLFEVSTMCVLRRTGGSVVEFLQLWPCSPYLPHRRSIQYMQLKDSKTSTRFAISSIQLPRKTNGDTLPWGWLSRLQHPPVLHARSIQCGAEDNRLLCCTHGE